MKEIQQARFMLEAISLSAYGMIHNEGGPFGCVIVKNNSIIGRGSNQVISLNDPGQSRLKVLENRI